MTCRPLVSIVTATHNALEGLKETVASIDAQTFRDFEHVVIDGASTDGTEDWLASRSDIRWISEPDRGIADALNKGVEMAKGKWILVLHSEDTFAGPDSLAGAAAHLGWDVDVVCFDVAFLTKAGTRRLPSFGLSPRLNWKPFPHQGAFTRAELFDTIGAFDASYAISMDYEFYLRAYRSGARSEVDHFIVTRMSGTGVSSRRDWVSLRQRFNEERAIHLRHCSSLALRLTYAMYWPMYLTYRRTRVLVFGEYAFQQR